MCDTRDIERFAQIDFVTPCAGFSGGARAARRPANSNRPCGAPGRPVRDDPAGVAEAELFAVEAMYLGADLLEALKRVNRGITRDQKARTARIARTLLCWGVGATSGGMGVG